MVAKGVHRETSVPRTALSSISMQISCILLGRMVPPRLRACRHDVDAAHNQRKIQAGKHDLRVTLHACHAHHCKEQEKIP
jgi:hypothetical protein